MGEAMGGEGRATRQVAAAAIFHGGRILAAQRRGGSLAHLWEFPGGKVEPGETPEQALARELMEELRLEARVLGLLARVGHDYGSLSVDLLVYRCALLSPPSAMELRVHERALWLWPHELSRLDWLPADRGIIAALADGQPCGTTDPAGSID